MALSQGLIRTKRVHLGLSEVAFNLYRGALASGVAFMRDSTVLYVQCYTVWSFHDIISSTVALYGCSQTRQLFSLPLCELIIFYMGKESVTEHDHYLNFIGKVKS